MPNVTIGLIGYGYWGPNLLRNYMELPRRTAQVGVRPRPRAPRRRRQRATRRSWPRRPRRRRARRPRGRRRAHRDADLLALRLGDAGACAPASTSSSRSPWPPASPSATRCAPRPTSAASTLMVGHTFVFSPPVRAVKEHHRLRRARRHLLRHLLARQPRPAPEGRERGVGPRAARPLDPRLLARRDPASRSRPWVAAASTTASPTWPS